MAYIYGTTMAFVWETKENHKTKVRIDDLWVKIWVWDLQNTKLETHSPVTFSQSLWRVDDVRMDCEW